MNELHCPICDAGDNNDVYKWIICNKHKKEIEDGFVFILECDPDRSKVRKVSNILIGISEEYSVMGDTYKTGRCLSVKKDVLRCLLKKEPSDIQFINPTGYRIILRLMEEAT